MHALWLRDGQYNRFRIKDAESLANQRLPGLEFWFLVLGMMLTSLPPSARFINITSWDQGWRLLALLHVHPTSSSPTTHMLHTHSEIEKVKPQTLP